MVGPAPMFLGVLRRRVSALSSDPRWQQCPFGFFAMGDAMNLRPRMAAWPVEIDWRTRHPSRVNRLTRGA